MKTSDGVELAAVATAPAEKSGPASEWGAVMVHGISLNHAEPLNLAICEMLTRRGLTCLSVDMRWHDGYDPSVIRNTTFEDTLLDLRASIDWLANKGVKRVILLGHSLGSQRIAYYHVTSHDPRVAGLVFVEPARVDGDCHRTLLRAWGEQEVRSLLAQAQELVRSGKGDEVMQVPSHHGAMIQSTARAFVSYDGEDTNASYKHMPHIKVPLLVLAGEEADRVRAFGFKPDRRALVEAAVHSPHKRLVMIEGADHFFSGRLPAFAQALDTWLAEVVALFDKAPT